MVQENSKKVKLSEPVSIVAHQLKTPIAVLRGFMEVLLSQDIGTINEKQEEYLNDALTNVQRISNIVSDILDVSKIEEEKYWLKTEIVDLAKITQEAIDEFLSLARASNSEITFNKPKDPIFVNADPIKIREVIKNLISNAIKYKFAGKGKVEVGIRRETDAILFTCRDDGIGIPEEDFNRAFAKFYRSEDALEIDPSGTGLGLYINQAIIKLSGGKIWFEKNKNKGMTFYFTLPAR